MPAAGAKHSWSDSMPGRKDKLLSEKMYTERYIRELQNRTGKDPSLLERVVYAFGLLEAICRAELPFCFKGGTALMLLLEHPGRLSTDIDIIVEPGTDIMPYIRKAGEIFPFTDVEEQTRAGKGNIVKRHFRFHYDSPRSGRSVAILLDVLFERLPYGKMTERPIRNELLLTEGEDLCVSMPNENEILGDKLTAFAPHTAGIPFGAGKELEIIKQLFDCACLFEAMTDFSEVKDTWEKVVQTELQYRGIQTAPEEVLQDTIDACLCIASRGIPEGDYAYYKDGISRIRSHILRGKFSGEIAGAYACRVLYLAVSILRGQNTVMRIEDASAYSGQTVGLDRPRRFSYLRFADPLSMGYLIEAGKLLTGH